MVEAAPDTLSLPDTVQAVIRTRLDNLEPAAREVLARGGGDRPGVRARAPRRGAAARSVDLVPALARLEGLRPDPDRRRLQGGYRFTHALTQEVSYDSLLGTSASRCTT